MNFIERLNPTTTVQVIANKVPRIGITSDALAKMFVYVDECNDEVGWLGTVKQINEKYYIIDDVFLFDQEVHGTTTEITPEGLAEFAEELLKREDGLEIWNNLKMWGHSHVNMTVTPSGQDDKQMKDFAEVGHDWFIRLICNKKGDMKLDFFHYNLGIAFLDVPWEEVASEEEEAIQEEMKRLQQLLEQAKEKRVEAYKEPIKEEMKTKVRKKTYAYSYVNNYVSSSRVYANQYGRYENGKWKRWDEYPPTEEEKKIYRNTIPSTYLGNTAKMTTTIGGTKKKEEKESEKRKIGRYLEQDVLESDDDVIRLFTTNELVEFAYCNSLYELEEELELCGYVQFFTENDLERIYRVAHKVASKYGEILY